MKNHIELKNYGKIMSKHSFALYYSSLNNISSGSTIVIKEDDLLKRVQNVLRLRVGDHLILFNREMSVNCQVVQLEKKKICVSISQITQNKILNPEITIALPLLKKEAFEQSLYNCIELGASKIVPYYSQKTHRKTLSSKDLERAKKLMIAGAEQAKYFAFPHLNEVVSLNEVVVLKGQKIFFDPDGVSLHQVISQVNQNKPVVLLVGPEGDLTLEEKKNLKESNVKFCKLTPTVLRARQAVALAVGMFRSFLL